MTVPTMYVWSDGDKYLLSKAANKSGDYVSSEYRFEILSGVSHWIPEEPRYRRGSAARMVRGPSVRLT